MKYQYPLLRKVLEHYSQLKEDLSKVRLYSCTHLLEPQAEMYRLLIEFGFLPQNIVALGKIYSSNAEIINELRLAGISVSQPTFEGKEFDLEHAYNCQEIAKQIGRNFQNIILDDGGYLLNAARSKPIWFGVEQTSSGYRKLEKETFDFPIYNVARSKTKLTQESPIVARQVFELVTKYVNGVGLTRPKVLIVGLGPIGAASLEIFEANGFDVKGLDIETSTTDLISCLEVQKPDVIIGATGSSLFDRSDLTKLQGDHIYHFISVSSSDREFPVAYYRKAEGVHDNVTYKNFVFVNNGFPISFLGYRNSLTPIEIEKTIALLMGSVLHGLTHKAEAKGFIEVPEELQDLINS